MPEDVVLEGVVREPEPANSVRGELVAQLGHQREVPGGQRVDAHDVHVGLDGLLRHLGGGLEQRPDIDVEPEVGERRGDDLLPAVVAVLTHLGDQDARAPALFRDERLHRLVHLGNGRGVPGLERVNARDRLHLGGIAGEHRLERVADLPDGGAGARGVDRAREQVVLQPVAGGGPGGREA